MARYLLHVVTPFAKRLQFTTLVNKQTLHLLVHGMDLEGTEHFIAVAQLSQEIIFKRRYVRLHKTLHRGIIDDAQHLTPHVSILYHVRILDAMLIHMAHESLLHICAHADLRGVVHGSTVMAAAAAVGVTVVQTVNGGGQILLAPLVGEATAKKLLRRFFMDEGCLVEG